MSCQKRSVIPFLSSESEPELEELRKSLERNTKEILNLFRKRSQIARQIGALKEKKSLPVRIRQREKEIINAIPEADLLSRAIISSLFEFTIINENENKNGNPYGDETISLSGKPEHLQLLAGLIVSAPGVEVYAEKPIPDTLSSGIQSNGGHLVLGELKDPDLVVGIDHDGACSIRISSSGTMSIDIGCLVSPKARRIVVRQH